MTYSNSLIFKVLSTFSTSTLKNTNPTWFQEDFICYAHSPKLRLCLFHLQLSREGYI